MTHRRLEPLLIAGSCAISFFAQAAAFNDVRFDDAYVTYRYAQNLAMGRGFVFNPGEHILGTTAPGHALVGALLYLVAGKIAFPAVMAALGCIGWTAEAACVYALLADAIGSAGAGFIALAIAMGATRAYFWVPLETHLVTALVLGAFVLAARERWIACGVVAGLAVVVRADAAVACAVLGALALMGRRADGAARPGSLAPAAAFGLAVSVVAGAWTAFSLAYFKTILPHTFHAKIAHGSMADYAVHVLRYPALSLAPWSRIADSAIDGSWLTAGPIWALGIGGAIAMGRRSRVLAALAVYGALMAISYTVLHPDPAFGWHLYPVTLVLAVFALAALVVLASRLRAPAFVASPLAGVLTLAFAVEASSFARRSPWIPSYGARDSLDHTVAAYLAASAGPRDYVDAEEVGTVAYLSGLPMVDHPGLVSDDAIRQLFDAARGRPSRVRWAVLNRWESETAKAALAHFHRMVFEEDKLQLTVYDLRAPDH